jgi:hypothetical protein
MNFTCYIQYTKIDNADTTISTCSIRFQLILDFPDMIIKLEQMVFEHNLHTNNSENAIKPNHPCHSAELLLVGPVNFSLWMKSVPCEPEHYDARQKLPFLVNRFCGLMSMIVTDLDTMISQPVINHTRTLG